MREQESREVPQCLQVSCMGVPVYAKQPAAMQLDNLQPPEQHRAVLQNRHGRVALAPLPRPQVAQGR